MKNRPVNALRPDIDTALQRVRDKGLVLEAEIIESTFDSVIALAEELNERYGAAAEASVRYRNTGETLFNRLKMARDDLELAKVADKKRRKDAQSAITSRHQRAQPGKEQYKTAVVERYRELLNNDPDLTKDDAARLIHSEGDKLAAPRPPGTKYRFIRNCLNNADY